jgi:shikimate kinase
VKTNVVLYGFMGSGKSAVARRLGELHGLDVLDTDSMIEDLEGATIDEIFRTRGELAFRGLERDVVREVAERDRAVIATGGGVPLDQRNVELLARRGVGILLMASAPVVLERVRTHGERPLLRGSLDVGRIQSLMADRREAYARIPLRVDTAARSVDQVAGEVWRLFTETRGQETSRKRTVRL